MDKNILDFIEVFAKFLDNNSIHIQDIEDIRTEDEDLIIEVKDLGLTRTFKVKINEFN